MLQEFVQQVEEATRDIVNEIHTALPGTIDKFDAVTGMAIVTPAGKFKTPSGKSMDYPSITGVPVIIPQCASMDIQIAFPIKNGDSCLIIISEQELDAWLYNGESDSELKFDLTSAIAIPGLSNTGSTSLKEAYDDNAIIIHNKNSKLKIAKDEVSISTGDNNIVVSKSGITVRGNLTVQGNINYTGSLTRS